MKRDVNFTCSLLSYLELSVEPLGVDEFELLNEFSVQDDISDQSDAFELLKEQLSYHLAILESGDLVRASFQDGDESSYYSLTWAGHDYLDAQRLACGENILRALAE